MAQRDTSEAEGPSAAFEAARPRLWGVAYRMLGAVADAEDAVQDVYLKWRAVDQAAIEQPQAWLVAVCTRHCIDILRSARKARVDYVGLWLPEPLVGAAPAAQEEHLELASSLTTAFLVLLERLTPVERAAYLLRDVFDYPYEKVAFVLDKNEAATRQIVSRAKKRLEEGRVRGEVPAGRQQALLEEFLSALESGSTDRMEALLSDDIEFWGDGGGKVPAGDLEAITSPKQVAAFLAEVWHNNRYQYEFIRASVNCAPGLVLCHDGRVDAVVTLVFDSTAKCTRIFVVRNPDKLRHLSASNIVF